MRDAVQTAVFQLILGLVSSDWRIGRVTVFRIQYSNFLVKLFIEKIHRYVLYIQTTKKKLN
jgi:hypothetical protein